MPRPNELLFSDRFQVIFEHMGVFSYLYYGRECRGLTRDIYIEESGFYKSDTDAILDFLKCHDLINEREGLLHLNRRRFFSMTMWDLLLLTEPWLKREAPPDTQKSYSALRRFARSEKLCTAFSTI